MIPLIIEDNFLSDEDFSDVKEYFGHLHIVEDMLQKIAREKLYNHRKKLRDIVKNERCSHSDSPDDCFYNIYFNTHQPGYIKEPHLDNTWKLLSSVLYIGDEGNGTIFMHGDREEQIEWKLNRVVSFIPSEDSWHRYENTLNSERLTMTFFYGNKISEHKIK